MAPLCSFRAWTTIGLWVALANAASGYWLVLQPGSAQAAGDTAKLIQQLGAASFSERERASNALGAMGLRVLNDVREAADKNSDPEVRRRAALLVQVIENSFEALIAEYRHLDLPLPPQNAKLVRYAYASGGNKFEYTFYRICFLVKPESRRALPKVLVGTMEDIPGWMSEPPALEPEKLSSKDIQALLTSDGRTDAGLELAIQCQARGWDKLAQAIFVYNQEHTTLSARTQLLTSAYEYWCRQLHEPNTNWKVIARRLKSILAADKGLAGSVDLAILRSLDAALLARKAKPGSIAALIDDLVDCRLDYVRGQWHTEPSYQKILLLGFDAVPELLEHLDDDRLTRTRQPAMGNNRGYHYRVRDVVSDLLRRLAAADPGETTDFRKWWASAQKIGEEKYLVDHVFRSQPDAKEPNAHQLWIIAEKYPWRLPEIYKTLLDRRPEWWNWSVAEAIGRSKLPRSKKVELLVSGGKQKNLHHRYAALQQLKDLDKEASIKILSDTLDHLPESTRGWMPREAWFAALVLEIDDRRAWQALLKAAKRADARLRMEYVKVLCLPEGTPAQCWQRARFLSEFLDDATEARSSWGSSNVQVRNWAALAIASQLELPGVPGSYRYPSGVEGWSPEQWNRLRNQVLQALRTAPASVGQEPVQNK